jgi:hypothetical protein
LIPKFRNPRFGPPKVRRTSDLVQPVRHLLQVLIEKIGIYVKRPGCLRMPEHPLHSLDIGTDAHGKGCSRVSEFMRMEPLGDPW